MMTRASERRKKESGNFERNYYPARNRSNPKVGIVPPPEGCFFPPDKNQKKRRKVETFPAFFSKSVERAPPSASQKQKEPDYQLGSELLM